MAKTRIDGEVEALIGLLEIQALYHEVDLSSTSEDKIWIHQLHKHVRKCVESFQTDFTKISEECSTLCADVIRHLTSFHSTHKRKKTGLLKSLLPTHIPILSVTEAVSAAKESGGICNNLLQAWENGPSIRACSVDSRYLEAFPGFMIGKVQCTEGRHGSGTFLFSDGSEKVPISFLDPPPKASESWVMVASWNCVSDVTTHACVLEAHGASVLAVNAREETTEYPSNKRRTTHTIVGSLRNVTSVIQVNRTKGQSFFVAELEGIVVGENVEQNKSQSGAKTPQEDIRTLKIMFMDRLDLHPFLLNLLDDDVEVKVKGLALSKLVNLGGMEVYRSTKATDVVNLKVGLLRSLPQPTLTRLFPQLSSDEPLPSLLDYILGGNHQVKECSDETFSFVGTVTGYHTSLAYLEIDDLALILLTHFPGLSLAGVRKGCRVRCNSVYPLRQVSGGEASLVVFAAGPRTSFAVKEFSPLKSLPLDILVRSSAYKLIRQSCERYSFAAALWLVKLIEWLEKKGCLQKLAGWTMEGYIPCHKNILVALLEAYRAYCDQAATFFQHARAGKDDLLEEVLLGKVYHLLEDKAGCTLPYPADFNTFQLAMVQHCRSKVSRKEDFALLGDELRGTSGCKLEQGGVSLHKCTSKEFGVALVGFLRCHHGAYYLEEMVSEITSCGMSELQIRFKEGDGHVHRFHLDHLYAIFDYDVVAEESQPSLNLHESNFHVLVSIGNLKCIMWDEAAFHFAHRVVESLQHLLLVRVIRKSINMTSMKGKKRVCLSGEVLPVRLSTADCRPGEKGHLKLQYHPGACPLTTRVMLQGVTGGSRTVSYEFTEEQLRWHPTICTGLLYFFHENGAHRATCSSNTTATFFHPFRFDIDQQAQTASRGTTPAVLSCPSIALIHPKAVQKSTVRDGAASVRDILRLGKLGVMKAIDEHQFQSRSTGYRDMVNFTGVILCKPRFSRGKAENKLDLGHSYIELRSLQGWDTVALYIHTNHIKIVEGIEPGYVVTVCGAERNMGASLSIYCRSTESTHMVVNQRAYKQIDQTNSHLKWIYPFQGPTGPSQQVDQWQAFQELSLIPDPQSLDLRSYWTLCRVSTIRVLEFCWSCTQHHQEVESAWNGNTLSDRREWHRSCHGGDDCHSSLQVNKFRAFLEDGTALVDCYLEQQQAFAILGINPSLQGSKGSRIWRKFTSLAQKYGRVIVTKQGMYEASAGSSPWEAYGESRDPLLRVPLAVEDLLVLETCLQQVQAQPPFLVHYRQQFRKHKHAPTGKYPWQPLFSQQEGKREILQHGMAKVKVLGVQQCSPLAVAQDLLVATNKN